MFPAVFSDRDAEHPWLDFLQSAASAASPPRRSSPIAMWGLVGFRARRCWTASTSPRCRSAAPLALASALGRVSVGVQLASSSNGPAAAGHGGRRHGPRFQLRGFAQEA